MPDLSFFKIKHPVAVAAATGLAIGATTRLSYDLYNQGTNFSFRSIFNFYDNDVIDINTQVVVGLAIGFIFAYANMQEEKTVDIEKSAHSTLAWFI